MPTNACKAYSCAKMLSRSIGSVLKLCLVRHSQRQGLCLSHERRTVENSVWSAGGKQVEERGDLVEECEVPIEAAADDKGSEHDSDSDIDPDECACTSHFPF
jgi:hypothetical protein